MILNDIKISTVFHFILDWDLDWLFYLSRLQCVSPATFRPHVQEFTGLPRNQKPNYFNDRPLYTIDKNNGSIAVITAIHTSFIIQHHFSYLTFWYIDPMWKKKMFIVVTMSSLHRHRWGNVCEMKVNNIWHLTESMSKAWETEWSEWISLVAPRWPRFLKG